MSKNRPSWRPDRLHLAIHYYRFQDDAFSIRKFYADDDVCNGYNKERFKGSIIAKKTRLLERQQLGALSRL
ncbi:hypothetical protein JV35_00720 [Pectobacterium betavasculorum]|uniref:Uncharacterized protein n=1 Tax=Pectobacterium betavasculorum TaxID=55207 RepID=A0ABR4V2Q7_9GAMM|nr:hypothetical protein JV35_00720 [Pectobacterium betavasculorum]